MSTPLDFGNGIIAHFEGMPGALRDTYGRIEKGHYGFLAPTVEVNVTEHGIGDGGTVGTIRATARRMRCTVTHKALWTRREIAQAFTPDVLRTLSTDLGSMPYYVEALEFPESLSEARRKFTVNLVSPLAYPRGILQEVLASSTYTYTTTSYETGTEKADVDVVVGYEARIMQTIGVDSGDRLSKAGVKVKTNYGRYGGTPVTVGVYCYPAAADPIFATLIAERTYTVPDVWLDPEDDYINHAWVSCDEVASGDNYFVRLKYDTRYIIPYTDTAAGCSTGVGYYFDAGVWEPGDSDDSTTDWAHTFTVGTPDTDTTTVYLDPQTEVPCEPVITVTLGEAAEELTITDGVNTATITASMDADDVVVLDSANRSLTINDVDSIAAFDRDGDWPMLYPDSGYIETSVAGTIGVVWAPKLMGLI